MFLIYRSKSHTDGKSLFPFDFCYIPFLAAQDRLSRRDIGREIVEKTAIDDYDNNVNDLGKGYIK